MASEIKAPTFPESIEEGTLMTWHRQIGETLDVDDKVVEIETDKIVLEVVALTAGTLVEITKEEGDTVASGEVIGRIGKGVTPMDSTSAEGREPRSPEESEDSTLPPESDSPVDPEILTEDPNRDQGLGISPSARKLILEHNLDPANIPGSGRKGRITKSDVMKSLNGATPTSTAVPDTSLSLPRPPPSGATDSRSEERVPMSRIRARIAERLVEAQQTAAILTTFNEVNMEPIVHLRGRYREDFEKKHGVRLGFMPFFIKASVEALRQFPSVNGAIENSDIVYHHYYDIGVAVSGPRGLLVPILRDVDTLSFPAIEQSILDFSTRAKENRIAIEELQGGTFTISNGGVFGSMLSTPILNPPQSGILGMHNITERPVAENGNVVIRPVMYLALSYDHRIVDGREAVQFLVAIKETLEDPARLLLQV